MIREPHQLRPILLAEICRNLRPLLQIIILQRIIIRRRNQIIPTLRDIQRVHIILAMLEHHSRLELLQQLSSQIYSSSHSLHFNYSNLPFPRLIYSLMDSLFDSFLEYSKVPQVQQIYIKVSIYSFRNCRSGPWVSAGS